MKRRNRWRRRIMKKLIVAALAISAFALAPVAIFASDTSEEIEEACRQAAIDAGVPADESADFILDCIDASLEGTEGEGAEAAEEPALSAE
jgi:hypothetical protein